MSYAVLTHAWASATDNYPSFGLVDCVLFRLFFNNVNGWRLVKFGSLSRASGW